jgi:diguanylate cyclase (GGDEF)-like protein
MLGADEIAMSDSEPPQTNPERDGAPASSVGRPVKRAPRQPDQSSVPSALEQESTDGDAGPTMPPSSRADRLGRFKRMVPARKGVWAAVAVLCVAVGAVGSLLGAHAVASTDAAKARQAFPRASAGIASTLKLAIQHEEDLIISGSTFFAGKPNASSTEFDTWVKWAQALRRYPELQKLSLVALVRAPELPAFEARITGAPVKPRLSPSSKLPASPSSPPMRSGLRIVPSGTRPYYCLAAVELARSPVKHLRAGLDYCPLTAGLLSSRDSAQSIYAPAAAGRSQGLGVQTPVYRGNVAPSTFASRRGAFVGWLREVLVPGAMLQQVLLGHPQYAVRLRHKVSSSNVVFTSGAPQPDAQSSATKLHNGWTVRTFGPAPAGAGVLTDGNALALLIAGSLLSVLLGLVVFLLGARRSAEPARKAREVPHEDLYDALTGLPNRALALDLAERMVARAQRQSGMLAGALVIDIDWFKDVNDKLGQVAGDQLLRTVAERLESVVRVGDIVGRLGGDEFVVLVESEARAARLDSVARRMMEALHKPVALDDFGPSFFLTASIGIAFGQYAAPEDLLRDAHLALDAGKAGGKNRYTLFNANMRSVIEGRGALEAELNTALLDKQFFLLYQPIYDLRTQQVVGLEALIRWRHPTQGVLAPADFIPLAEETGLIVPIGRWALEEACSRAAAWNVAGHRVGISVQVSANQLNRDGFATDVRRALQQSGIEPSLLTLEIAEATVMLDIAAATERLEEITQLGVRIAIDDFGSGYAHRSDLQRMPLDFLKVDRTSLAASDDEDYRSWLLEAILHFARALSVTVIAKGIETDEQMTTIQAMGCTMAQGLFMGEPTPAHAVESLFEAGSPTAHAASPTPARPPAANGTPFEP